MMFNTFIIIQSGSKFIENIEKCPIFLNFSYCCNVNLYYRMTDTLSKGSNFNTLKTGSILRNKITLLRLSSNWLLTSLTVINCDIIGEVLKKDNTINMLYFGRIIVKYINF